MTLFSSRCPAMVSESVSLISSDNQETVLELSSGELQLGRGPLLGITEAKVSRVHAVLRLSESNQVEVKPVSKNPLFYYQKVPGVDTVKRRTIPKDVYFELNDGDMISFLPDSLRFCLKVKKKESPNSLPQTLDDPVEFDAASPEGPVLEVSETPEMPIETGENSSGSELSPNKQIISSVPGDSGTSPGGNGTSSTVSPRKRKLPDWMSTNGTSKTANLTPQKRCITKAATSHSKTPSKFESTTLPESRSNDLVDDSILANLSPVIAVEPLVENTPVIAVNRLSLEKSGGSLPHKSDVSIPDKSDASVDQNSRVEPSNQQGSNTYDRRQKCQYGRKCYRRNTAHRRELAHPGDPDYISSDSDEASSSMMSVTPATPICPYGTKCYRKNAAHKANFRHDIDPELDDDDVEDSNVSSSRERNSRKRNVRSEQRLDDEFDGTYDYDDSFINDASELDDESSEEDDDLSDEDFEVEDLPSTSRNSSRRKNSRREKQRNGPSRGSNSRRNRVDSSDEEESEQEDFNQLVRESNAFIRRENKKTSKK